MECATEAQRKVEIEKLNKSVDWFLSIVEEVPEGVAQQFRAAVTGRAADVNGPDMNAFRQAIAHPLWATHMMREAGADIKHELRPQTPDTPATQLHRAISALERSAPFIHQLRSATPVLFRLPLHRRRSRILKLGRFDSLRQSGRSGTKIQVWGFVKCVGWWRFCCFCHPSRLSSRTPSGRRTHALYHPVLLGA